MEDTKTIQIHTFPLGAYQTNCYVLEAPNKACWIIDAGTDPDALIACIKDNELKPEKLLLTHAHHDHIEGVFKVREAFPDIPIYIHESEKEFLTDTTLNLSAIVGIPAVAPEADHYLEHGQVLHLAGIPFEVRHTPGHSPGGVGFYQPENHFIISGDTLFAGSVGRYDFPTSDGPTLGKSILEQLYTLPDDTVVYPGHGPSTSIGQEKQTNPFVRP
ncbi:putative metallo-hydrolase [Poriferisphaera corsica]|uniref:Putative metallo-hydrolase n=1 Tax=Poriferisphaera corsica TaxID=2528020 RepID=A0A517YTR7_9BACT|nr:MBL fold metallo-hydrolase [Poriferisphaera corsica]QDU33616.1 putative metallo-hydrolase [Poriferisphaera corsica]